MTEQPRRLADSGVPPLLRLPSKPPRRAWEHSALEPVSARPPLVDYLGQLWDRRHFMSLHAYSQAMGQHQGTWAGRAWLLLAPLLDGAVYWFIFGVAFGQRQGVPDFATRLIVGILIFSWASRSILGCSGALNAGRGLMRAFSFPRASLPIAVIMKESVTLVPTLVTICALSMLIPPHALPQRYWLFVPLPLLLMSGFNLGVGLVLARVNSVVPDVAKVLPYGMRFWMYGSGVIFDVSKFSAQPTVLAVVQANPLYITIEMVREMLLYGRLPAAQQWYLLALWGVGGLVIGLIYFWRGEASYGRQRVA